MVNNEGSTPFGIGFDSLTVLIGDGTGQFTVSSPLPTGGGPPNSAAMADFNGDGRLDFTAGWVYLQAPPGLVNSVSPSSGSGQTQTFTAVYSDGFAANGNHYSFAAHNLTRVTFQMNTSFVAASGCYVVFDQYDQGLNPQYPANLLYLYDDPHKDLLGQSRPDSPELCPTANAPLMAPTHLRAFSSII